MKFLTFSRGNAPKSSKNRKKEYFFEKLLFLTCLARASERPRQPDMVWEGFVQDGLCEFGGNGRAGLSGLGYGLD